MPDYVETSTLSLLRSANPVALPAGTWVELTREQFQAASAIPPRYREWTGSAVAEMREAEKAAVDAAAQAAMIQQLRADADTGLVTNRDDRSLIIRALARLVLDEVNTLRSEAGLPARTWAQMVTAIRNKIASGEGEA